jgi:hypothetical protein
LARAIVKAREQKHRQQYVHNRTHHGDQKSLPFGTGEKLLNTAREILMRILSGHFHITAEGDRTNLVVGLSFSKPKKSWAKTHSKGLHPNPQELGDKEVSKLVNDDNCAKYKKNTQNIR